MTIEIRHDGPAGWLIFDRPDAANAIDAQMFVDLEQAWAELDADDTVSVIVNTGNGHAFQTGLDVVQLARDPEALKASSRQTKRAELRLRLDKTGDHGLRRRRTPLRCRRRHRHRIDQRRVPGHRGHLAKEKSDGVHCPHGLPRPT